MASPEERISTHEMARDSTVGQIQSPIGNDINQQILELRKEQEMQKQRLWHTFQEEKKQLELQHQLQLEQKYQFAVLSHDVFQEYREQRIAAEQEQQLRERQAKEAQAAQLRRKESNCNPNASTEVKQKLQEFIRNKQAANGITSPFERKGVFKSSSGPINSSISSHPYKIPPPPPSAIAKYESDFPLRKTASEPNLLMKIRLKSVIDRKSRCVGSSMAVRRQERYQLAARRQQKQQNSAINSNCASSTPDSGPNSPPALANRGSPTSAPIQEENEDPQYQSGTRGSINDLSLFSSPSMPNISLGRPHLSSSHNISHSNLLPLRPAGTSSTMIGGPGGLFYTQYPSIELGGAEGPPQAHTAQLQMSTLGLHQSNLYGQPITDAHVAQARLYKQGHRPLGRTQSAPLPLGHPRLNAGGPAGLKGSFNQTHYGNVPVDGNDGVDLSIGEANQMRNSIFQQDRQAYDQQRHLLQKIRQTVLTRSGREPQLKEEDTSEVSVCDEVIDLTDKKQPPKTVLTSSVITSTSHHNLPDDRLRDQDYLHHQREILRQSMQVSGGLMRPLSRTLSSPLVHMVVGSTDTGQNDNTPPVNLTVSHKRSLNGSPHKITTGLAFDSLMLKHACMCGDNSSHPEHSGRLQSVWARLVETGLASRCDRLRSRKATQEELQTVHTEAHALIYGANQINRQKLEATRRSFTRMLCGGIGADLDTPWNEHHTAAASRMAAGCVIDLAFKTAKGDIRNGFAVVRPPGHHAEADLAMGFCIFNSVAIAAKLLLLRLPEIKKILIVDWDVHHGNGTEQAFYDNPNVLYLSIHRHDDGNFFPGTGGPTECGTGPGLGFNVNIAWSGGLNPPLGDAEYLAAFRTIVMPIAKAFNPDIVLVSAGFDPAVGHPAPLGGYLVTPACFGHLTRELMNLADGKIVLALEGGYDLPAICDSAQECVKALLGDEPANIPEVELQRSPCKNAIETLQKTIAIQSLYWPAVKRLAQTIGFSAMRAICSERDESETVTAMAGLSMQPPNSILLISRQSDVSCPDSQEPMDQDDLK